MKTKAKPRAKPKVKANRSKKPNLRIEQLKHNIDSLIKENFKIKSGNILLEQEDNNTHPPSATANDSMHDLFRELGGKDTRSVDSYDKQVATGNVDKPSNKDCIDRMKDRTDILSAGVRSALDSVEQIEGKGHEERLADVEKHLSNQMKEMMDAHNKISQIDPTSYHTLLAMLNDQVHKFSKEVPAYYDSTRDALERHRIVQGELSERIARLERINDDLPITEKSDETGSRISQAFDLVKGELAYVSTPEQKTIIGEVLARLAMLS